MDYGEMISEIREWVAAKSGQSITIGIPGPEEAVTISSNAAGVLNTYFDRRELRDMTLTVYVKRASQMEAAALCDGLGRLMTRAAEYPSGDGWRVKTMQSGGAIPVGQDESTKLWLYVNNVEITYYS
ncbi:MAG: hypothetical protein QM270_07070 [Bacillota bacterium]|nr:hypothetical protein [Bacillota bacterium]